SASDDERHCRNADGYRGGEHFQSVHLVNIVDATNAEQCHDQKSAACSEVANVDANEEHSHEEPGVVAAPAGKILQPSAKRKAKHEHHRCEEQQPRQEFSKHLIAGSQKKKASDLSSDSSSQSKGQQCPAMPMKLFAEGYERSQLAWPQSDGVGGLQGYSSDANDRCVGEECGQR